MPLTGALPERTGDFVLRVGILGCGIHGERYLRHLLRDIDDAKPTLFYRRDLEASARIVAEYSVPRAESASALVESDQVDAVIIATPPGRHLADLALALDAGKPVLLEKPAVARWSEAADLRTLDEPTVMVGQTLRYSPILQRTYDRMAEIGDVHRIRVAQRLEPSPLQWQRDPQMAGGGSITLTGVHLFDLLRWFVGRTPDAVECRMQNLQGHPLENAFDACFEYEAEAILASTEVSKFSRSRSALLELVGSDAQLVVDYMRGIAWSVRDTHWTLLEDSGAVPTMVGLLRDFVRLARGEIESPISLRDGIENVRMAEACYRSHRLAERVLLIDLEES